MIVTMLMFETFTWIFFAHFGEVLPAWLRVLCFAVWFIVHFVAYASEDNLREKVKRLEDEIKELKKGGAEG